MRRSTDWQLELLSVVFCFFFPDSFSLLILCFSSMMFYAIHLRQQWNFNSCTHHHHFKNPFRDENIIFSLFGGCLLAFTYIICLHKFLPKLNPTSNLEHPIRLKIKSNYTEFSKMWKTYVPFFDVIRTPVRFYFKRNERFCTFTLMNIII